MDKKSLTTIAIVGVIALIVGYVFGIVQGGKNVEAKYAEKIEAVKKMFPSMPEMRSLSGTVKSVSGKVITLETTTFGNPFEEVPKVREVTVGSNTKITKNEMLAPEEFQKLNEEYQVKLQKFQKEQQAAMSAGEIAPPPMSGYPMPPTGFREITISVSDIKPGDMISVNTDTNIKMEKKFEATTIVVTSAPSIPSAAPAPAPAPAPVMPAAPINP